jgi:hypothetical protein
LLALIGCVTTPEVVDTGELPLEHLFSFAVFADPHVTVGAVEHQERLAAAVAAVNDEATSRKIEMVVVVGDIGWGDGLPMSKALLDDLDMPYVPVIGDNEVHAGDGERFDDVFGPQFSLLESTMDAWQRGPVALYDPVLETDVWLQNFSFGYRGIRFVGLDWCSRDPGTILGEMAELNDYDGGSLPFFGAEVSRIEGIGIEDVLLFSHHPMYVSPGGFSVDEMERITGLTGPVSHRIAANFAGHYHLNHDETVYDAGYDLFITDAIWDDENTVRMVEVWGNGTRFAYEQELFIVP